MDQRVRLKYEQGESAVALSEHYGVSRKTLYKWLARYEEHGTAGLAGGGAGRRITVHKASAKK